MKVKVIEKFIDKNTGKVRKPSDPPFTCTKERFEEILKSGKYVEEYTETKDEKPAKSAGKAKAE